MGKTIALEAKAYQELAEYAKNRDLSIRRAASEIILAGVKGHQSMSGSGLECPSCGRSMNFIYVGIGPGRYQLYAACKSCE